MKAIAGLSFRLSGARACLSLWTALSGACLLEPGSLEESAPVDEPVASALADPACTTGIPNGDVCCAASCGSCGGTGCGSRPGGARACCTGPIAAAGVSCSGAEPPCIMGEDGDDDPGTPRWELLRADFQRQSTGTYTQSKVASDFGAAASWSNGLREGRARIVQEGNNRFLRVTYPANQFGPGNGGVQFEVSLHGRHEELYLAYRVRFAPGFDFVQGGKLPGLVGGSSPTGCTTDRTGGFSARNMWRPGGSVAQYLYHPERQNRCGDDWYYRISGSNVRFTPGRWHTIEHHIKMGTSGQRDGVMQAYIDGRLALDGRLKWRNSGASYGIDKLFFSTFFGGSNQSWAPRSQQQADFDDFVVADRPITH
jgi:hypothetical protein